MSVGYTELKPTGDTGGRGPRCPLLQQANKGEAFFMSSGDGEGGGPPIARSVSEHVWGCRSRQDPKTYLSKTGAYRQRSQLTLLYATYE